MTIARLTVYSIDKKCALLHSVSDEHMLQCSYVIHYMDTSAAAYRIVSAACNLPVLYGKWQTARRYLKS